MLRRLHVRNYVLIDTLEIEFPEGLVIVTGQTGAGKSIITGALSMVMGARADASVLGLNADNCVVEAEFEANSDNERLRLLVEENEADWDEGHLLIRRVISKSGRSRAFVNDSPVPVASLVSISAELIDIHSQHQTLLLSDNRFQLSILDMYAGNAGLLAEYSQEWRLHNQLKTEVESLALRLSRASAEKDYLESQFIQLSEARLRDGELEELEDEQKRLANAEEIKQYLCTAESMLDGDGSYGGGDTRSLLAELKEVLRVLDKVSSYIPDISVLSSRLESCRLEIEDVQSEISDTNSSVDVSPERLQEVDDRISFLYGLMHKHSCSNICELMEYRDSLSATITDSVSLQEDLEEKQKSLESVKNRIETLAALLHDRRCEAAPSFAEEIQGTLRYLELPYSVFVAEVLSSELGQTGADTVVFKFSSAGKNPVSVAKCASGGELSRMMLSLKVLMSRFFKMPTMIFDEIDTGVSGSVADKMGTLICEMGNYMQVFAITHLPQVAAKGSAHYLVSKNIDPQTSKAVTSIKKLSDEQRVLEVARMLSGSVLTDAAVANARDLLKS